MNILENILLAQDFDESSKNVTNAAIELAKTFHSTITPIHVLHYTSLNEKVEKLLKQTVTTKLNATKKLIESHNVKAAEPILETGVVFETIAKSALQNKANIIVTGSGEDRTNQVFKLGTTTERIIQNSEKPVFVVKENKPLNVNTILCPVDFSDTSKRALSNAIVMARRFNAKLIILSVCGKETSSWFFSPEELVLENESQAIQHKAEYDAFIKDFNLKDVNYTIETKQGQPAEEILNNIIQNNIDLLVMGTTGKTGINRLIMGSVTEKVIREVPCSFITLKSEDVINLQLQSNIKDFEQLYQYGIQLNKDGFYNEAIEQLKACLSYNIMHVPAYHAIADIYEKLNAPEKAKTYRKSAAEIKDRIWYSKIEEEVRKLRGS